MSASFLFGRARWILGVVTVMAFSALVLTGCGKDGDDDPSGGLACGSDEAWVMAKDDERNFVVAMIIAQMEAEYGSLLRDVDAVGIVLKPDHSVVIAVQLTWTDALVEGLIGMVLEEQGYAGSAEETQVMIELMKPAIFSVVGGKNTKGWYGMAPEGAAWGQYGNNLIMISDGEESGSIPFTISGNSLIIEAGAEMPPVTLTKKSGVSVKLLDELLNDFMGGGGIVIPPGSGGDPGLVLGTGEAWTGVDKDGDDIGYIFQPNGGFIVMDRYYSDDWSGYMVGAWAANNGSITITAYGVQIPGTYSINGDVLTFSYPGTTEILTRTAGVNPEIGVFKSRTNKKMPKLLSKKAL